MTRTLGGYLELVRPPNVATSLGDVLAGFAVAGLNSPRALPWLLAASACLYAGGVVLNDVFDRDLDAVERPERPLPSGRIPVKNAAWLGGGLLAAGMTAASLATPTAGMVALAIAACVLIYDAWGKRQTVIGPLNMGLCRGLNLVLGIAATPAAIAGSWPVALVPVGYISGITALSRGEVSGGTRGPAALALALLALVVLALIALGFSSENGKWAPVALTVLFAWRVVPAFWAAYRQPDAGTIRTAVRKGVVSLVLLDAAIAAAYAGAAYSVALLAVALLAGWLARSFAVT